MGSEYHSNEATPFEIAHENFKEFFPEHSDLSYEELLLQQESVYLSLQASGKNKDIRSSDRGQSSSSSGVLGLEEESSLSSSIESQLALDEALARSLQEIGEDFDELCISDDSNAAGNGEFIHANSPVRSVSQDTIDPDSMTYEQLSLLGESVGSENKGLSKDIISRLPSFKYKTGLFSKKKIKEDCVICCTAPKSGEELMILPCAHQYHSKCITRWLELNKACPICQEEVRCD